MAIVSISEAARLVQKSRTTIYRYIKEGKLSTCTDSNNADGVDTSELIRVFGSISLVTNEQSKLDINEHSVTSDNCSNEQHSLNITIVQKDFEIDNLKQKIEFLEVLLKEKDLMVIEKEKRLLLLEYQQESSTKSGWLKNIFIRNKK